jgi:hypothetical protein
MIIPQMPVIGMNAKYEVDCAPSCMWIVEQVIEGVCNPWHGSASETISIENLVKLGTLGPNWCVCGNEIPSLKQISCVVNVFRLPLDAVLSPISLFRSLKTWSMIYAHLWVQPISAHQQNLKPTSTEASNCSHCLQIAQSEHYSAGTCSTSWSTTKQ